MVEISILLVLGLSVCFVEGSSFQRGFGWVRPKKKNCSDVIAVSFQQLVKSIICPRGRGTKK